MGMSPRTRSGSTKKAAKAGFCQAKHTLKPPIKDQNIYIRQSKAGRSPGLTEMPHWSKPKELRKFADLVKVSDGKLAKAPKHLIYKNKMLKADVDVIKAAFPQQYEKGWANYCQREIAHAFVVVFKN